MGQVSLRVVPSPLGDLRLVASDSGLRAVVWPGEDHVGRVPDDVVPAEGRRGVHLDRAAAQLVDYFEGRALAFDLPLDVAGTPFQRQAWRALSTIPYGQTITYAEQARVIGRPTAARAVGSANRVNPVGIVVPCHRVVAAGGALAGFAAGLPVKAWLLDHERAVVRARRQELAATP